MYKYVRRKGKVIFISFIVLLLFYSILLGYMGRTARQVISDSRDTSYHIQRLNAIMFEELVRLQSLHLETMRTAWHDWNWDFERGDFSQIFARFISRSIAPFPGVDGQNHVLVYSRGELLFSGNEGLLFEAPPFFDDNEYMQPLFVVVGECLEEGSPCFDAIPFGKGDRYIWNKIILPTPSSHYPRLQVLIGFSESAIYARDEGNSDAIYQKAQQVEKGGERFLLYAVACILVTVIAGYVVMVQFKQAEFDAFILDIEKGMAVGRKGGEGGEGGRGGEGGAGEKGGEGGRGEKGGS